MNISKDDFQFLVECLITDMVKLLISHYHYSLDESMRMVYTSQTLQKLERLETGLYYQSTVYVMNFLLEELGIPPLYKMLPDKRLTTATEF